MSDSPAAKTALMNGLRLRCPQCGRGKLFVRYLKLGDSCPQCGENLTSIRADDGPAWLSILITGHIVVPLLIYLETSTGWPDWAVLTAIFAVTTAIALSLLPFAKGLFVAAIWITRRRRAPT